jgi:hypothetical protein
MKKTYSLHNYNKCFSLNIYSQKARVATADKKYDNYAFVDAIKLMKEWPIKAINQLICSKIGKRLLLQWEARKAAQWYGEYLP